MRTLTDILRESSSRHKHICPRQVLGARIGMYAGRILELDLPRSDKRLLTIAETDGCFLDGISAAIGCTVGHRTIRIEDYGKVAATFVDARIDRAVRVAPRLDIREHAYAYARGERRRYFAQMQAYQVMPAEEMLTVRDVILNVPIGKIISRPGARVNCDVCGEEIMNEREIHSDGLMLCRACFGDGYYRPGNLSVTFHAESLAESDSFPQVDVFQMPS